MRYEEEAVHIDGGQDQAGHEDDQAEGQAAQPVERRLPGPQGQNQLLLVLEKKTPIQEHFKNRPRNPFCCSLNEPTPADGE